ncbi:MAG: right-handed parallel beta-helix repeat-containing protein, partial [Actinomycetota bacterium]
PGGGGGGKDERPKLVVPRDYKTIQRAVNRAEPDSTIVIRPGVYRESVAVQTSDLVIRGTDRFRTVLHGRDVEANGFLVDGVRDVTIKNLTVRNFTSNGIFFNDVVGYKATRIDSIKNRTYGLYAFDSYDGVFSNSFGYGSGDSAFYVGQCLGCSALVQRVTAERNFIGYSGTNATGVVIRDSVFRNNGAGIVPNTLPTEELGPNRGTMIVDNRVLDNNYDTIPEAGISETFGIPFGTGVWLVGVENNAVRRNYIEGHDRYGVLVTQGLDPEDVPRNNRVVSNTIRDSGRNHMAWDGTGDRNCFSSNDFVGATGPANLESTYPCPNDLTGTPFPPVQADVAASLSGGESREQIEPPDPRRPRCQRGRRGCRR